MPRCHRTAGGWRSAPARRVDRRGAAGAALSVGGESRALALGCAAPCIGDSRPTWLGPNLHRLHPLHRVGRPALRVRGRALLARVHDGRAVGGLTRVSPTGDDGSWEDLQARPTPNGRYVVFMRFSTETGDGAAFRMDRQGGNVQQLTPWELSADLPHPSPARVGPTAGLVLFQPERGGQPRGQLP